MTQTRGAELNVPVSPKALMVWFIFAVVFIVILGVHARLNPKPTFAEAASAIVLEHPECADKITLIKQTWAMPSWSGGITTGVHSLAVCEAADVRVVIQPE